MVASSSSKKFVEHVTAEHHHASEVANIVFLEGISPVVRSFL